MSENIFQCLLALVKLGSSESIKLITKKEIEEKNISNLIANQVREFNFQKAYYK